MKLVLALIAALALPASALAQIDLTWENCVIPDAGEPLPAIDQALDCSSFHFYQLHGSFTPLTRGQIKSQYR